LVNHTKSVCIEIHRISKGALSLFPARLWLANLLRIDILRAVKRSMLYHYICVVFAAVFILFQSATLAHTTEHGDNSHEHDGMVCVVDAIAADVEYVHPIVIFATPIIYSSDTKVTTLLKPVFYARPPGRAPPPRSPPTFV